jgi:hypothetical protein
MLIHNFFPSTGIVAGPDYQQNKVLAISPSFAKASYPKPGISKVLMKKII